ncbi:Zinc finger MIZ domain-containing protein 2 [Coniochaeta hoffmannii]|uniref:Zinc finger MIZ domain-containing protein 2 n=1 Tax=Coniochaeta hoffmannii TaxID=91930 RepID=A0AA38S9E2_9PEZI|nr:Zinc finger MIZ domain-containing protein 2 [Coniochaeta hoffmannii]
MQSWTSPGQLANEEVRGQPSPSQWLFQQQPQPGQPSSGLQSFQQEPQAPPQHHNQIFIQQQQAQQVQHAQQMLANMTNQQQHQNLLPFLPSLQQHQHQQQHQQQQHQHQHQQHQQHPYQQQQPQQMAAQYQSGSQTVNQLRQQLHERMLQQQQTARLQAQRQQQAQLATSHQMTALQNLLPASPATHPATRTGALSNQPQSSFPDPQAFFPNVIPTPGVSPVNLQFPSGSRAQHPLAQPNLASRGTAPESGPAVFGPSAAMRQANPQLQQQNAQAVSQMRLIPPLGHAIQLSDWPPDPYDRKAIMMSLHQADVRSPRRTVRHSAVGKLGDRFYQAVESFPVVPTLIAFVRRLLKYQFVVSETQFARISQTVPQAAGIPVMEHFNGSLRWRVRTCKIPPGKKQMAGPHEWVGMETSWPEHITISLNGRPIAVRRRQHNSRDQPSELTPFIRQGINELAIAVAEPKRKTPGQFAVAVEIVETRSHSSIIEHVWKNCVIQEDETLDRIKSRLSASRHDDDSVQIVAEDLSIDLADPFSRVMFKTPARGAHCTHMECFDLETWLETRPSKPVRCPHSSFIPCDCRDNPEPSVADKWKCPICDGDARPYALRIDGFLLGVRKRLEEEGKLKAKSILVARDGTWQPVVEDSDGDDTDEDDEGGVPRRTKKSASAGPPPATATAKKQPVEVIELLDD